MTIKNNYVKKIIIFSIIFIGLCGVFFIPYLFPSKEVAFSASYNYGFNNKIGITILFIECIVLIVLGVLFQKQKSIEITKFFSPEKKESQQITKKRMIITSLVVFLLSLLIWFISTKFYENESWGFSESEYFISHLYELSFGKIPYKDFEFCYGSLYIYIPWIVHICLPFFSITTAYFVTFIITNLLGIYLFYEVLNHLDLPVNEKGFIFSIISILTFSWFGGINFNLLRFVLPAWMFIKIYETEKKNNSISYTILIVFFTILALQTSTELGIVFCIALIVYNFFKYIYTKRIIYIFDIVFTLIVCIGVYLVMPNMFQQIFSFSGGGLNWPFVVSYILISFFLCVYGLSFYIGLQLCNIKDNLFDLSFELMIFGFIPACLGRCDPGHVTSNGLFIFILAYVCVIRFINSIKTQKIINKLFFLVFFAIIPYSFYTGLFNYGSIAAKNIIYLTSIKNGDIKIPELYIKIGDKVGINVYEKISHLNSYKQTDTNIDLYEEKLGKYNKIAMPFNASNSLYAWANRNKKAVNLNFRSLEIVGNSAGFDINLQKMKDEKPDALILPKNWNDKCNPLDYTLNIKLLFCAPYPISTKYNGSELYLPILKWINENYHETDNLDSNTIIYISN